MDPSLLILTLSICFFFLAISAQSQQHVSPLSPPSPQPHPPRQQHPHHPLPPSPLHSAPKTTISDSKHSNRDKNNDKKHHKSKKKPNWGKILGFMFVGVAGILQVCVLVFLLIKRRQLLKAERNI